MALSDINFNEGESQDFILEIATGSLLAAEDILTFDSFGELLYEIEAAAPESNIFIMSE